MRGLRQRALALVLSCVGLAPAAAYGQSQTLTGYWDPNPPSDQVTSYEVCLGTTSGSCNVAQASVPASQTSYTFTPSPGVLYHFAVRAINSSGPSVYSTEVTASIPNLVQPSNQTSTVNVAITPLNLSVSDPDGGTLQFSHTGLPLGLTINTSTGRISGTPTAVGSYNVTVSVYDGLLTVFKSFTWTVSDTAAPALSVTSHSSGQTVSSANITLSGTATDNNAGNSGISSVTVNGQAATGGAATGNGVANWSKTLTLVSGANAISVVATDGAGNARTVSMTLNLSAAPSDTVAPTVAIASHTPGQTVSSANITLTGTATDSGVGGSGITTVTVNGQAAAGGTASGNGIANWSRSLTLASGANVITVNATDGANNTRSTQITINLTPPDTTAPILAITSHTSGQTVTNANVALSGTATDSGAGGSGITSVTVNGQTASGGTAAGSAVANWNRTVTLSGGANTVTVLATDGAGNVRSQQITLNVSLPSPVMTAASLAASVASPQNAGTQVNFTASGTGGIAPYQYQWYVQRSGGAWQLVQPWSTAATYAWIPSQAGTYMIAIWARSAGSTANAWQAYAERSFTINPAPAPPPPPAPAPAPPPPAPAPAPAPPPGGGAMTSASLVMNLSSPQTTGTSLVYTASGTGGTAPYEYQWYLQRNSGAWELIRGWTPGTTYTFTPTVPGTYMMAIWARSAGSTANAWQAYAERAVTINAAPAPPPPPAPAPAPPPPAPAPAPAPPPGGGSMTSASLVMNLSSPQITGTSLVYTASGTGGTAPYEYQWYLQRNSGAWELIRGWTPGTTYTFTPTAPGTYMMAIWARSAGSTANAWQAYAERAVTINAAPAPPPPPAPAPAPPPPAPAPVPPPSPGLPAGMTGASLSVNVPSPQAAGTPLVFTASGTGGVAPYQYRWYVQLGNGSWQMVRDYHPSTTYGWTPAVPGTYTVAIWARSNGATSDLWQAYAQTAFVVNPAAGTPAPPPAPAPVPPTPAPAPSSMTGLTLIADRSSVIVGETSALLSASGSGGVAPYEYKWYLFADGAWYLLRGWSPSSTYRWAPTHRGTFTIAVWGRSAGVTADEWQAYGEKVIVAGP